MDKLNIYRLFYLIKLNKIKNYLFILLLHFHKKYNNKLYIIEKFLNKINFFKINNKIQNCDLKNYFFYLII